MNEKRQGVSRNECVVHIDLPGEHVQCWNSRARKLKVVLRKHRDVIFDIQQFPGMMYTIRSDASDVYHVQQKKLIRKNQGITFKDGEKIHLWIGRDFRGSLKLEAAGKTIGRYYPAELDPCRYPSNPSDKPAPVIVALRNEAVENEQLESAKRAFPALDVKGDYVKFLDLTPIDVSFQGVEVFQVKQDSSDIPPQILKFIQDGREELSIDPGKVITRNWCISQVVGLAATYSDNSTWLHEIRHVEMRMQKVIHKAGPKYYLIFKGIPNLRGYLNAARYGSMNPKVLSITGGFGSGVGMRHAAWGAAKGAFSKCGLIAVAFNTAVSIAEWMKDYHDVDPKTGKPKRDFIDLLAKIGVDLAKAAISAAIGAAVIGALVGFGVIAGGVAFVVGLVVVTLVVSYLVDLADGKAETTKRLSDSLRAAGKELQRRIPMDYVGFDTRVESATVFELGAS